MQDFFAGIAVGVIILQTVIFAPTIFTTIDAAPAGKLLRALFPKFFRLLAFVGILTIIALIFSDSSSVAQYVMAGLTIVLPITCDCLIPTTNRATDVGNKKKFKILHTTSVVLTMIVLIANIALPLI